MRLAALDIAALDRALAGTRFQGRLDVHGEIGSTIDRCRGLAAEGAASGTTVVAEAQTSGRGQRGNTWHSPTGCGLYLSVLLRPDMAPEALPALAPLLGLAACESLRELGVACRLKLPNDLVTAHHGTWRKLGGMLVDTAVQGPDVRHAILSLGVNVFAPAAGWPEELRATAVACSELAPGAATRETLAARFLAQLERLLEAGFASEAERRRLEDRHSAHVRAVLPGQPAGSAPED